MFFSILKKLIVICVAVVALMLMVGLGTALAAQRQDDATAAHFTIKTAPLVAYATPATTTRYLIGTIQSVDQAKKTFTLLVMGQTKAITIAFDAKTNIHSRQQTFKLAAKAHVLVDVTTRSNGSLYATEVQPANVYGYDGMGRGGPRGACTSGTRPGMRY